MHCRLAELNALLAMPDVKEMLAAEGATARPGTPEDMGNLIKTDLVRWGKLIKDNDIQLD